VPDCEYRPTKRRKGKIMGKMRNLKVGDWIFFPIGRWNAVRSSATAMKKQYGTIFVVNRVGDEVRAMRTF
jgi:hypothetical protein